MQRVERHIVLGSKKMDAICFLSKNLYNLANYYIRQEFINHKYWLRYGSLDKLLQGSSAYKELPAQTAQQTLRLLDKNWVSFFKNIKQYKKNNSLGKPNLPKYKNKITGRNITIFTGQQIGVKDASINFPKKTGLTPIKTKVKEIDQVRIIPQATCYVIEVVYTKEVKNVETVKDTYLSIDVGVNNLATCTNNIGKDPFIVNGRVLKSINQYYNKKKAELSAIRTAGKDVKKVADKEYFKSTRQMRTLTHKRNNKVIDYLHKTSKFIVNYCIKNKIETVVIGKNKNWKQNINIGKRNNQNFVGIPFAKLIAQLQYKLEDVGINLLCQEESYTSKCSFLDLEPVKKQIKYAGRRIKRGLFKSANKILINADVNGSLNILRKAFPKVFSDGIAAVGLQPLIVNI